MIYCNLGHVDHASRYSRDEGISGCNNRLSPKDALNRVRVVVIHKDYNATSPFHMSVDVHELCDTLPTSAALYTLENAEQSVYAKYVFMFTQLVTCKVFSLCFCYFLFLSLSVLFSLISFSFPFPLSFPYVFPLPSLPFLCLLALISFQAIYQFVNLLLEAGARRRKRERIMTASAMEGERMESCGERKIWIEEQGQRHDKKRKRWCELTWAATL